MVLPICLFRNSIMSSLGPLKSTQFNGQIDSDDNLSDFEQVSSSSVNLDRINPGFESTRVESFDPRDTAAETAKSQATPLVRPTLVVQPTLSNTFETLTESQIQNIIEPPTKKGF